jgi:peptidoglycan-associated lipoprotein
MTHTKNGASFMTIYSRGIILASVLALAACTNPDRFDGAGGAGGPGGAGGMGGIGAPGSVSDPRSPAYFQQVIGDRVLFAVDQSSITPQYQSVLDGQAQWLMTNTDYVAIIEGHADEQGTREYNLALGARRANAVQEYLISRGVAPSRLRVISYGKERPIELCSNEACYSQNRRAVTVISAGLSS